MLVRVVGAVQPTNQPTMCLLQESEKLSAQVTAASEAAAKVQEQLADAQAAAQVGLMGLAHRAGGELCHARACCVCTHGVCMCDVSGRVLLMSFMPECVMALMTAS